MIHLWNLGYNNRFKIYCMYILKSQYRPNIVLSIEVNRYFLPFPFVCPFPSLFSVSPCVFLFSLSLMLLFSPSPTLFLSLSHLLLSVLFSFPSTSPQCSSCSLPPFLWIVSSMAV